MAQAVEEASGPPPPGAAGLQLGGSQPAPLEAMQPSVAQSGEALTVLQVGVVRGEGKGREGKSGQSAAWVRLLRSALVSVLIWQMNSVFGEGWFTTYSRQHSIVLCLFSGQAAAHTH